MRPKKAHGAPGSVHCPHQNLFHNDEVGICDRSGCWVRRVGVGVGTPVPSRRARVVRSSRRSTVRGVIRTLIAAGTGDTRISWMGKTIRRSEGDVKGGRVSPDDRIVIAREGKDDGSG